jgi:hypothetical protein
VRTRKLWEDITFKKKELVTLVLPRKILDSSTTLSRKTIMVMFVAAILETHVLIAPCTISLGLYYKKHSRAIAYYARLSQLRKNRITITSGKRTSGVPLRLPIL